MSSDLTAFKGFKFDFFYILEVLTSFSIEISFDKESETAFCLVFSYFLEDSLIFHRWTFCGGRALIRLRQS